MLFAKLYCNYRIELVADFQQFYHLDVYGMSIWRAADLAAALPLESRCMKLLDPLHGWTIRDEIASRIEYWLHVLVWRDTEDAKWKRNVPEQITPKQEKTEKQEFAIPVDEYAELLSRPRKEEKDGNGTRERVHNIDPVVEGGAEDD